MLFVCPEYMQIHVGVPGAWRSWSRVTCTGESYQTCEGEGLTKQASPTGAFSRCASKGFAKNSNKNQILSFTCGFRADATLPSAPKLREACFQFLSVGTGDLDVRENSSGFPSFRLSEFKI